MSGNVWEWEDACDANGDPKDDACSNGAGSFWDEGPNDLQCATPMASFCWRYCSVEASASASVEAAPASGAAEVKILP
jgi:hypothetical protein